MRKILCRLLDPLAAARSIQRVVEAGCGTGHMARVLEQRYGWTIFPTDLSAEGLAYARQAGLPRLARSDIRALPYAAAGFDALVSLDVIVHLERGEEGTALAEFARVLKPRGLLVLRAAALDILHSRHSEFAHERQRFTRRRLVRAVEAQGFRMLRATYANSLLMPVALARFRVWEPLLRKPPQSGTGLLPRWLDAPLYCALAAERVWLGGGMDFAAGQSLILIAERE